MIIDTSTAVRTLQSIDKQIKENAKVPTKGSSVNDLLQDSVELTGGQEKGQGAAKANSAGFNNLMGELGAQLQPLMDLIGNETQRQGELSDMFGGAKGDEIQKRAQELLETYFNVENTGNRIFDFAFSFYQPGEDREVYAREKQELIHEGFRQAEKILGGLSDISLETRDYIDQRVEDFISEGKQGETGDAGEGGVVEG